MIGENVHTLRFMIEIISTVVILLVLTYSPNNCT